VFCYLLFASDCVCVVFIASYLLFWLLFDIILFFYYYLLLVIKLVYANTCCAVLVTMYLFVLVLVDMYVCVVFLMSSDYYCFCVSFVASYFVFVC